MVTDSSPARSDSKKHASRRKGRPGRTPASVSPSKLARRGRSTSRSISSVTWRRKPFVECCRDRRVVVGRRSPAGANAPSPRQRGPRRLGRRRGNGRAASAWRVGDRVDVLLEFPCEAGLADARLAGDKHQAGASLLRSGVEELLHQPQLAVAPDERRFEPVDPLRAARTAVVRTAWNSSTGNDLPFSSCVPVET